jgi:hypothetical protein
MQHLGLHSVPAYRYSELARRGASAEQLRVAINARHCSLRYNPSATLKST